MRQALLSANTNAGADNIVFQISGTAPFTITPLSALPSITDPVVIDATTQLGYTNRPIIELSGVSTSSGTIGLRILTSASTVRGLAINRFPAQAIELSGVSNVVQGNFIGTDVTGTLARGGGTGSYGILVKGANNLIGGTNSGEGNLIAGGNDTGIYLLNVNSNTVQGNLIGLALSGTTSLSNLNNGIVLFGSGGNLIGGPTAAARNVISGNGASGVYLNGAAATGNIIQGNRIGTGSAGTNAVGNLAGDGITLNGAPNNLIISNVISGNGLAGISISGSGVTSNLIRGNFIGTDFGGKTNLGNHFSGIAISGTSGNLIGGTNNGDGNVIAGNLQDGVVLTGGTTTNVIQGNFIGLAVTGTNALPNGQNGISISTATANLIGGPSASARNIISGNAFNGIGILTLADGGNLVQGNYLGTDSTGTKAIGNTLAGVRIQGSSNTIGGTVSGAGNLISGNGQQGVWLVGTNGSVKGNRIQGNLIGLTIAGNTKLANGNAGVGISTAAANVVGGLALAERNVIAGNGDAGIFILGSNANANVVQGNYLGTDASGTLAIGNAFEGIYLEQGATNLIGGAQSGAGNLISANNTQGIFLTNATANIIQGNFIGTKADGVNPLGNKFHNIELQANASRNFIGGSGLGAGNRLAYAQTVFCGVRVRSGATNNLISGNSIFGNGALGIDLSPTDGSAGAGVNAILACESGVATSAANRGQNFPTLTNVYCGSNTRIRGVMNGQTGKTYALEFFASPTVDLTGYGEGQFYLGQTNVTLGGNCSTNFSVALPVTVAADWVVTATATDANNNTSEFSAGVTNVLVPSLRATRTSPNQVSIAWTNNGGSFNLLQTFSLNSPISWLTVTNVPVLTTNFMVTTLSSTNGNVFYRLSVP